MVIMDPAQFVTKYTGQSLLWAPSPAREYLRGQCVQLDCFYVSEVWHTPVIWADAYAWFAGGAYPGDYERIANDHNNPDQVPPPGALIVWGPGLPGSDGAGHIAVCVVAIPGAATFVSFDSNWGGKTAHLVTHNWAYVAGWIVPKTVPAAAPAAPAGGSEEMIANTDQAHTAYKLLRPNGDGSPDEINGTAGRRTWQEFAEGAGPEIAARDANLRAQAQHLQDMSNTINAQNEAITSLTMKLNDAAASNTEKQQALDEALNKLAVTNAQLTAKHDQIKDLQKAVPVTPPAAATDWFTKLLAAVLRLKR